MKTQIRKSEPSPTQSLLPILMGKEIGAELADEELEKIALFEKGLGQELKKEDTIEMAVTKIVRMAVAAEFGASLVVSQGARQMINTISRGILTDSELRKQALLILDRFAHA